MRLLSAFLLVLLFSGCSTSPIRIGYYIESTEIDYPETGATVTKGLGERLVTKGIRTTEPAIEVLETTQFNKKEGESSLMTCAVTVTPVTASKRGVYEKGSIKADCFGPVNFVITLSDGSTNWNCPGRMVSGDICHDVNGKFFIATVASTAPLEQDYDHIKLIDKKVIERRDNFTQELIYNGRVGDNLKFVYREFSDDLIRPAFTQEIQYDLSESSVIVFKALRLKIVEADNREVTYILDNNF